MNSFASFFAGTPSTHDSIVMPVDPATKLSSQSMHSSRQYSSPRRLCSRNCDACGFSFLYAARSFFPIGEPKAMNMLHIPSNHFSRLFISLRSISFSFRTTDPWNTVCTLEPSEGLLATLVSPYLYVGSGVICSCAKKSRISPFSFSRNRNHIWKAQRLKITAQLAERLPSARSASPIRTCGIRG